MYSVLMSVYYKEKDSNLKAAMESMWQQTVPTDDFVLVCDGPLNTALDEVIAEMKKKHPDTLNVIHLEKNMGLGIALNIGIKHCKNELVARMDSDDISRKDRCEKQMQVFSSQPGVSICSGTVEEFTEVPNRIEGKRILPETKDAIRKYAKKRNPFNHPCVMYKKSEVESAGGYEDFYLLEDYHLWIRMLQKGAVGYNIQEPLLWMRAGTSMYSRRGGWKYAKSQKELFHYMKEIDFISRREYISSAIIRIAASLSPAWIRKKAFKALMREE